MQTFYENIPDELRPLKRWGLFELKFDPSRNKNTKIPIDAMTGNNAKTNDPSTWCDFKTAKEGLEKNSRASGLAFFFGDGYVGLDIDHIANDIELKELGNAENEVDEFINLTDHTYGEISQSGEGLHFIFKGKIPGKRRHKSNYEMYQDGRFFALTGNMITSNTISELSSDQMTTLYTRLFGKEDKVIDLHPQDETQAIDLPVPDIIRKMLDSSKGQRDRLFMQGGWEKIYASQSEADLAFANDLAFWTGKDPEKMDTIFRNSALMRDKWDEKHGAVTYGEMTINKAIAGTTSVYHPTSDIAGPFVDNVFKFNVPPESAERAKNAEHPHRSYDDMGMAQRFQDRWPDTFRYLVADKEWYYYDKDNVWKKDDRKNVEKACDVVINELKDEPLYVPEGVSEEDATKAFIKFKKHMRSRAAKEAMIKEIMHLLAVSHGEFDQDPMLLNVKNGYVDLTDGTLHDADWTKMFSRQASVEFSPNAEYDHPMWDKFLYQTFGGDHEAIEYIQKAIGYSLTGLTSEQVLFFCYGKGRNGKSLMLKVISDILGSYSQTMSADTLIVKGSSNGANSDIARLEGARFVVSSELNEGSRLNEGLTKQITGGDRVVARHLYGKEFEFDPCCKIWMATNHEPIIRGTDEGIWRRIIILPFDHIIAKEDVDPKLYDKLMSEAVGILNWAVEGAIKYQLEGLDVTESIKSAVEDYRGQMDEVQAFLEDETMPCEGAQVSSKVLYSKFQDWARRNGEYVFSHKAFSQKMKDKCKKKHTKVGTVYLGIRTTETVIGDTAKEAQ